MNRTLVIAEAGVNHNGDLNLALRLVEAAANAGADVVKFQTFVSEEIATDQAEKAKYQKQTTESAESQLEMLQKLELTTEQHIQLQDHCKKCAIEFLSTAFDLESIDMLKSLNIKRWKIPSGEITNLAYLRRVGFQKQPVILSTGMANLGEIEAAIDVLEQAGTTRNQITVLHCTTEYPAPFDEVNLRAMQVIGQAFGVAVGYSDHTDGISVPIAAVAMGANVIEKHFTLDRKMLGPDHKSSLEQDQFSLMVKSIREVEQALGNGIKRPTASELSNMSVARKSLVASKPIKKGDMFCSANITSKRPGTGISPMLIDEIIGRHADRDFKVNEQIKI